MPCFLSECDPLMEVKRFGISFVGLYVYHFLWDTFIITPLTNYMIRKQWLAQAKRDKMRESLYKNAAVGAFFLFGLYIGSDKDWFMNPKGYFVDFPYNAPENLRWYYMIYLSFWFQGIDFMLNITNNHYKVKRKDNAEMLVHHFATISLMVFSYTFDLTRVGMCVLMIHDVNDLLLETAKIFVYLEWELVANIVFGSFALVWFIVRWGFYSYNILWSVYHEAWISIVSPIMEAGTFRGIDANIWYYIWVGFFSFLFLLLILHIYWGFLIVKMVKKALGDGNVEKDIRSDSEGEDEIDDEKDAKPTASVKKAPASPVADGKPKRRRAPKAD